VSAKPPRRRFCFTIQDAGQPGDAPTAVRLRQGLKRLSRSLAFRCVKRGIILLAVAAISPVVGGVGARSIVNCRPVGQARSRSVVATRLPADKHVADAQQARTAEQGG
jgi:hypothetical protein